jgi:sec-independent protein translocase protein TatA
MFGLGLSELIVILLIVLVIFGAKRLPELGSSIGKSITNFKNSMKEPESLDSKSSDEQNQEKQ